MALDFLKKIFKKKSNTALGIDIGTTSIKIVQVSKKGDTVVLDTYGELSLGPYADTSVGKATKLEPEKIAEALVALLSEKDVGVTAKTAGFAVPFEASLMTTFTLPAAATKDIASTVPIEARKYIPVPISEVTLDWSVIPSGDTDEKHKKGEHDLKILLVAIHNDILSDYQTITSKTKLDVHFFEIEIFSTVRAIVEDDSKPVLIIDMGALNTKLYILEHGVIQASHTINIGAQNVTEAIASSLRVSFTEAEIVKREVGLGKTEHGTDIKAAAKMPLDRIFTLANRVAYNYVQKSGVPLSAGYIVGGGASLKGVDAYATEMLKTKVEMGNPFKKLSTPAFIDDVLAKTGPEFVVAVGVALRALENE